MGLASNEGCSGVGPGSGSLGLLMYMTNHYLGHLYENTATYMMRTAVQQCRFVSDSLSSEKPQDLHYWTLLCQQFHLRSNCRQQDSQTTSMLALELQSDRQGGVSL